jgi:hypothetical protein
MLALEQQPSENNVVGNSEIAVVVQGLASVFSFLSFDEFLGILE